MKGCVLQTEARHRRVRIAYDAYELTDGAPAPADPDKRALVSVGRLSHGKGIHLLIDALAKDSLSQASVDIYGVSVAGDHYAADLVRRAEVLGDRVRFRGFRRDVVQRLPGYRFMVVPSRYETLGRVVVEAWDAGLVPIVCADSGGAAEIVRASDAGLIFDQWASQALADTLETALKMRECDRQALVAAGRAWVRSELSLETYKNALHGVLF
jgi:glycosyltransferase involved in cell wall biosynthesis